MLPVIIFVAVAVPLLVVGFVAMRRRAAEGGEGSVDAATQEEYEHEFADAEAYQEQWREEQHREHPDDRLY